MMSHAVVLLVEDDPRLAQLVLHTLASLALPHPHHVTSGEDAVLWVGAHTCDVCLLDYDLPGIDGLETLVRIHQRQPDLPVIMLSNAASEQVAVAAFRAGVRDYVPKQPGFPDVVARLVRQVVQANPAGHLPPPVLIGPEIPAQLLQSTYQNRLRVIGRQLDLYGYQSVNLWEVAGGFLVRGALPRRRTPEALEFPDRDFPQLVATTARGEGERRPRPSSLLPTGYEDFLRAIGHRLDEHLAEAITVSELNQSVVVTGLAKADGAGHTSFEPFEWTLCADDIAYLLDAAYRRREPAPKKSPSVLRRLAGQ